MLLYWELNASYQREETSTGVYEMRTHVVKGMCCCRNGSYLSLKQYCATLLPPSAMEACIHHVACQLRLVDV